MKGNRSVYTPHRPLAALCSLVLVVAVAAITPLAPAGAQSADGTVVIGGLMWATQTNGEDLNWEPANEYCGTLTLAGHDDWRLPTLSEVENLHDPAAADNGYIVRPITLDGCCLWSATPLAELSAEEAGVRGGQRDDPSNYFWGFLFDGAVRYYSINYFPDGQALCVRNTG
jgi:hypothetical protein